MESMKNDVGMSWEMYDFSDLVNDITGGNRKFQSFEYQANAAFPIVDQSEKFISGFTNENAIVKRKKDVVIFGDHTKALKFIDFDFCLGADGVKVLEPVEELDSKFLFYFLNTITLPNVGYSRHFKFLKEISIPLPPLPIQKRIAEILDAADALKLKDQALLKKYDELAQAIFIDMFGDPVKNEKGWEVKTIEQLVKKTRYSLKRGPFGGALKKEIFVSDGYLVYEQFHALNNDFTFGRYYINQEKYDELITFDVKPKDIIISCSGIYLGKLAIVPEGAKPGIINQALLKLTLDENIYKNEFFVKVFTQENFKETYFASERGAAIPNFPPMATFKEFKFICPPIKIQNEYLNLVQNLQNQTDIVSTEQKTTDNLFQTLIQKAFKGELVAE